MPGNMSSFVKQYEFEAHDRLVGAEPPPLPISSLSFHYQPRNGPPEDLVRFENDVHGVGF